MCGASKWLKINTKISSYLEWKTFFRLIAAVISEPNWKIVELWLDRATEQFPNLKTSVTLLLIRCYKEVPHKCIDWMSEWTDEWIDKILIEWIMNAKIYAWIKTLKDR